MDRNEHCAIIVSPLEFERRQLQRAGLHRKAELVCCGPGAAAMRRWFDDASPRTLDGRSVILAGLAGGLSESIAAGSARWIEAILGLDGQERVPTLSAPRDVSAATITSVQTALTTPAAKRRLAGQTQVDLVDLESVAFAESATKAGLKWAIVRGVSDDFNTTLPADIDRWVDARGRTRITPVARQLLLRPGSLGMMMRLGRDSRSAMQAVAQIVTEILG